MKFLPPQVIDALIPAVMSWCEQTEAQGLQLGRLLSPEELTIAQRLDILDPDRVRIVEVDHLPWPENGALLNGAEVLSIKRHDSASLCFRYAIYVRRGANILWQVAFELNHLRSIQSAPSYAEWLTEYCKSRAVNPAGGPLQIQSQAIANEYVAEVESTLACERDC